MVRKLLEGFWRVCDRDGSGSIDLEEYLFLHLNLYAAMNTEATQKEGWQDEAREVATREWDFDRQGHDQLESGPVLHVVLPDRGCLACWSSDN